MKRQRIMFAALAAAFCLAAWPVSARKLSVMPQYEFLNYCARGKLAQVGRGVKRRAEVDRVEQDTGLSPLICAAREQDDPRVIEYLVEKGARVERENFQGLTPLMFAAIYNPRPKIVGTLLKLGAQPNRSDPLGYTAVTYAARYNNAAVLERLLAESDVKIDSPSRNGLTPLMCAAQAGNKKAVAALIEKGARIDVKSPEGKTAAELAANDEIREMLLKVREGTGTKD